MFKFDINIEKEIIENAIKKIRKFDWSKVKTTKSWKMGTNKEQLLEICKYWTSEYKWHKEQEKLNTFNHFKAQVDNLDIHFIYEKGKTKNTIPLLISHGWPGSIVEFKNIIGPLTDPNKYNIDDTMSFDVIAPSIPGFIFSQSPTTPYGPRKIANIYNSLMQKVLGYNKYLAQGGDWGGAIASWLGYDYPEYCMGIHLNIMIMRDKNGPISKEEKKWHKDLVNSQLLEEGYRSLQSTKPQTLSYAMIDNPVGIAAWIIEKFYGWSDLRKLRFLEIYDIDDIITNIMLYIITNSFATSTWIYYGRRIEGGRILNIDNRRVEIPTACALFPEEFLLWPPKSYVERLYNVTQWTEFNKGGHFAALENPMALLNDIRYFSKQFR